MRRFSAAAALATLFAAPAWAQNFDNVVIKTEDLGAGLYMLVGAGGNIGLSVGADGVFMIDDQFAPLTPRIEAEVKRLTAADPAAAKSAWTKVGPVRFIINTHYHGDHTGGNEAWGGKRATLVAHDNVRARMVDPPASTFSGEKPKPSPAGGWPTLTFSDGVTFHLNGEIARVVHVPNAHTDGDALVHFEGPDVLHMGDVFFNGSFPYIDINAGGTIDGYIAAQKAALKLAGDKTKIIPGHGPLATKAELAATTAKLEGWRATIAGLVDLGVSWEDAVAAKPLDSDDAKWGQGFMKTDKFVEIVFKDLQARKEK